MNCRREITLLIDGKECLITSIDRQESGRIEINGGPAQGGEELRMVEEDSFYGSGEWQSEKLP